MRKREKEKSLHLSSCNHRKKESSKNRFANSKDTLTSPNKNTVSSQAKMSRSKYYSPLASWVPTILLTKINLYEPFTPSFKRKYFLQTFRAASNKGNQLTSRLPPASTSLPSAVKLIDTIPNGKRYGRLKREGNIWLWIQSMRGENIWINILLLNIYWKKLRYWQHVDLNVLCLFVLYDKGLLFILSFSYTKSSCRGREWNCLSFWPYQLVVGVFKHPFFLTPRPSGDLNLLGEVRGSTENKGQGTWAIPSSWAGERTIEQLSHLISSWADVSEVLDLLTQNTALWTWMKRSKESE